MKTIFFYGLFMDESLLASKGIHPQPGVTATAQGFGLRIGQRASLVASPLEHAYGVVMALNDADADRLYSGEGVSDYVPETLEVTDAAGNVYPAICYNLPLEMLTGSNSDYARALARVAREKGFPDSYIEQILSWAE